MEEIKRVLSALPFWPSLSEAERELLMGGAIIEDYAKKSVVCNSANACLGLSVVLAGEMRVCILSEEGREVTLCRLHPGDICVLSAVCVIHEITFESLLIAQTDCRILSILPGVFKRLIEQNIHIRCFTYEKATMRFSDAMWTMQQILFHGFDRRLAAFLIAEADRLGTNELRMTHEDIARYISSAREVVARMLKRFAEDGLLRVNRGSIVLTDRKGLELLL